MAVDLRTDLPRWASNTLSVFGVAAATSLAVVSGFGLPILGAFVALFGVRMAMKHVSRHLWPTLIVVAGSATAALVFLSAVRGETGRRQELVYYGIAVGIAAGVAILTLDRQTLRQRLIASLRQSSISSLDSVMWGSVVLAVGALAVGLLEGNATTFLIGDTYQLLLVPTLYFIFSTSMRSTVDVDTMLPIVVGLLLMQQARDLISGAMLLSTTALRRIQSVLWMHNLVGLIGASVLALVRTGQERRVWILASGAFIATGLMSGFRSYLFLVVLTAGVLFLTGPKRFLGTAFAALVVVVPISLAVYVSSTAVQDATNQIVASYVDRIQIGSDSDESTRQRWVEIEVVRDQVLNTGLQHALVGLGAGATFELPASASAAARRLYQETDFVVHNVHFTPAAYALRHGLVGLIYLLWLGGVALLWSFRAMARANQPQRWFAPIAVIAYLIASAGFDFLTGDVIFAFVLAILDVENSDRTMAGGRGRNRKADGSEVLVNDRSLELEPGRRAP